MTSASQNNEDHNIPAMYELVNNTLDDVHALCRVLVCKPFQLNILFKLNMFFLTNTIRCVRICRKLFK